MRLWANLCGKIIIPASYYIKGDLRFKYFNDYKKNLVKSKKEIKAYQLERLKKLVDHAYRTVPYYKKLFDRIQLRPDDIRSIEDLRKIPKLTKKSVLGNLEDLKSTGRYRLGKHFSGGSTGNSVVVYKDRRYEQLSHAIWMRDL